MDNATHKQISSTSQLTQAEDQFRSKLIDDIVVLWAALAATSYIFTTFRAFSIGWTYIDFIYTSLFIVLCITAIWRRQFSVNTKAVIIIVLNTMVGATGTSAFGMMAGAVFFFPVAAVVLALFYSQRIVILCGISYTLYMVFISLTFLNKWVHRTITGNDLINSPMHWMIYIICFCLFYLVTSITILNYRKKVEGLVKSMSKQKLELETSNRALQEALNEINTLREILPLCSYCKKIRQEDGSWEQVDVYIHKNFETDVSHSICPDCMQEHYPDIPE